MRELLLYVGAGIVFIALGVAVPEVLISWITGAGFLLLAAWAISALVRRLR